MAEVKFAGVSTSQTKLGKKLTKSLFRQILQEDLENNERNTKILGWINYYPPGLSGSSWGSQSHLVNHLIHVLFLNCNGELRRCLISKSKQNTIIKNGFKYNVEVKNKSFEQYLKKGQLFLDGRI